mmetsp:Transcript_79016/g.157090  ORF Transcript_79016/g.157090 Transcript_79016/m.157090 type:complete len:228 (+) Transcript_79016:439-1122(+)
MRAQSPVIFCTCKRKGRILPVFLGSTIFRRVLDSMNSTCCRSNAGPRHISTRQSTRSSSRPVTIAEAGAIAEKATSARLMCSASGRSVRPKASERCASSSTSTTRLNVEMTISRPSVVSYAENGGIWPRACNDVSSSAWVKTQVLEPEVSSPAATAMTCGTAGVAGGGATGVGKGAWGVGRLACIASSTGGISAAPWGMDVVAETVVAVGTASVATGAAWGVAGCGG